jgi:tetratricopeptide (TPR) repeat protein
MTPGPGDADDLLLQPRVSCELGRYEDAAALLGRIVASDQQHSAAWCWLAQARLGCRDDAAALRAADIAVSLEPDGEWPHRLASRALERLDRHDESIWEAREAVRAGPGAWAAFARLAMALSHDDRALDEADAVAQHALLLAPHQCEVHIAVGVVAAAAGRRGDAEAALLRAVTLDPGNGEAHAELARLRVRQSGFVRVEALADAADGFAAAVRSDPRADISRRSLGLVLRLFLSRIAWLLVLDAFLVARAASGFPLAARLVPAMLLSVPGVLAWRFVRRLSPALRRSLLRLLLDPRIGVAVALEGAAVLLVMAAAVAPSEFRTIPAGLAGVPALAGQVMLATQVEHSVRAVRGASTRPALGSGALWLVASASASWRCLCCSRHCSPRTTARWHWLSAFPSPQGAPGRCASCSYDDRDRRSAPLWNDRFILSAKPCRTRSSLLEESSRRDASLRHAGGVA